LQYSKKLPLKKKEMDAVLSSQDQWRHAETVPSTPPFPSTYTHETDMAF
jgi:hypothetical protein